MSSNPAASDFNGFQFEVFISYAHRDNVPLLDSEIGWVTQFDKLLDTLLGQHLGSEANIWRDNMLRGDDLIENAIRIQLPHIAVMISVLSPSYINSQWCLWEVEQFCKAALEKRIGYTIKNKSRIYKVLKMPIPSGDPPPIFNNLKGYEFFQQEKDDPPRPFGVEYGMDAKKNFLNKVGDLAFDISNLLAISRRRARAGAQSNARASTSRSPRPTSRSRTTASSASCLSASSSSYPKARSQKTSTTCRGPCAPASGAAAYPSTSSGRSTARARTATYTPTPTGSTSSRASTCATRSSRASSGCRRATSPKSCGSGSS